MSKLLPNPFNLSSSEITASVSEVESETTVVVSVVLGTEPEVVQKHTLLILLLVVVVAFKDGKLKGAFGIGTGNEAGK